MRLLQKHLAVLLCSVLTILPLLQAGQAPVQAASSTVVSLDSADSLDGWGSANPLALDTADKKEGTASIRMTGSREVQFVKTFADPVDSGLSWQNGSLRFWYYVEDVSTLDGTIGQVEITSSGGPDVDEISWDFAGRLKPQLVNGWNLVTLPLADRTATMGNPDLSAINFFRIYFFNAQSATVKLDHIFFEEINPNAVVLDPAESLDGWRSDNELTLDTDEKAEGLASIRMDGAGELEYEKSFEAPLNTLLTIDAGVLNFYYYAEDVAKLSGISVILSSSGGPDADRFRWDLTESPPQLANGWNLVSLDLADAEITGQPDLAAVNYFRLAVSKTETVTSRLDTIYFEEKTGLPTEDYIGSGSGTLTLHVTNGEGTGNKYAYHKIAMPDYRFEPGDYIEYDVKIDQDVEGAGGIELSTLEGDDFRESGWTDGNGLRGHPATDLSDYAYGQWHHRKLKVPRQMIGKHLDQLLIAGENDTPGLSYSAHYRNIVVTDRLGRLKQVLFAEPEHYNLVGIAYSAGVADSTVAGGVKPKKPHAKVIKTIYPTQDEVIAGFNVADYGADPTGTHDATAAFQQALNDCALAGGGVVYAPAGNYKMLGNLQVGNSCTLRGDWKAPSDADLTVGGTVLHVYAGRGDEEARPFITMGTAAGVRNLSIFYPEQSIQQVVPYPYAISQATPSSGTVMNVTLVNPYKGIAVDKKHNGLHYTRNVYGTPLKIGIFMELVFDVGRVEEVEFSPKYWAGSGLPGAPGFSEISNYTQGDHGSVGIIVGRNDWEVMNGVAIENYATGLKFVDSHGLSNGSIYNLRISGARTGIEIEAVSPIGWLIAASSIEASAGPDPVGVLAPAGFQHASLQFNKTKFQGTGTAARQLGNGLLSFVNSDFQSWNPTGFAIEAMRGTLLVHGSRFGETQEGQRHVKLGGALSSASLLSNDFQGEPAIVNENPNNDQIVIDQTPRTFESISGEPYVRAVHPKPNRTGQGNFYDVTKGKYKAKADGVTDDTAAIQAALDDAGRKGGGTVYLPAGKYRIDGHLNVPAGVELRGAQDVPFHTASHGTVLYAYVPEDRGSTEGTPFIRLNSDPERGGSGIRGILIWYPEQSVYDVTPYPWVIQSQGPNCWVIYTNISNAYLGVDFGTYNNNGHVIDYLSGAGLKTGLFVGNTSAEGWVENVHFNPTYWGGAGTLLNAPAPETHLTHIWPWQKENGNAFLFGYVAKGHVSETFVFGSRDGVRFIEQPGLGSFHGDIINHGTDGARYGVRFSAAGEQGVNFINFEAVQFDDGHFVVVDDTVSESAPIRLFNTNHWTSPTVGYDIRSGDVLLQQGHFTHGGSRGIQVSGGQVRIQAGYFAEAMPEHIRHEGGTVSVTGSAAAGGLSVTGSVYQDGNIRR